MFANSKTLLVCRVRDEANDVGSHIYNSIYQELGLNAVYLQFGTKDSKGFADALRTLNFSGCTVVGSHSKNIIPYLDELDPHAEKIGHINTLTNRNGHLKGYKTDGSGLIDAIQEVTSIEGKKVVVLGAGALTKELSYLLPSSKPRSVTIYNRTEDKARKLCESSNFSFGGGTQELLQAEGDIFINATDVGANFCDTKDIFPEEFIKKFETIADVTYLPFSTPLQEKAGKLKKKVVPGWRMFAHQGARQVKLYVGANASIDRLCELIKEEFGGK
jgi:shikimate dehydrogenase